MIVRPEVVGHEGAGAARDADRPEGGDVHGAPALRLVNGETSAATAEREVRGVRRAKVSVVLEALGRLSLLALVFGGGLFLVVTGRAPELGVRACVGAVLLALVVLAWEAIKRDSHRCCVTDQRVMWRFGVLRRVIVDVPLERVQHVVVHQTLAERVLGLGTVRVSTAANDGADIVMRYVEKPEELSELLHAARRARLSQMPSERGDAVMGVKYPAGRTDHSSTMPVIGIVGGIGAGKSTVAQSFQRLGCYVVDSDARAREALDRPDVREQLVQWWGADILTPGGRVDRTKVGSIVFGLPAERARLEGLVHPIVRQERARMIEEAAQYWAKGVIVDAPLLFEAGVDKECDAVVFVESSREVRLERVRRTRGWSEAEFDRREAAQMALDDKRARCQYVIVNDGEQNLDAQAERVLSDLSRKLG